MKRSQSALQGSQKREGVSHPAPVQHTRAELTSLLPITPKIAEMALSRRPSRVADFPPRAILQSAPRLSQPHVVSAASVGRFIAPGSKPGAGLTWSRCRRRTPITGVPQRRTSGLCPAAPQGPAAPGIGSTQRESALAKYGGVAAPKLEQVGRQLEHRSLRARPVQGRVTRKLAEPTHAGMPECLLQATSSFV